jgi:hypothetical protein
VSNVLRDLAKSTGHSLHLDPAVWQSLLVVVDADDNGLVDWNELVQIMGEVFKHIQRERALQTVLQENPSLKMATEGIATPGETGHVANDVEKGGKDLAGPSVVLKMRESRGALRVRLDTGNQ